MPRKLCPSCHRPTSSAGGICDPCRLGVPLGTEGLQVHYPPEPRPSLRQRIARLLHGSVAWVVYSCAAAGTLVLIGLRVPEFRIASVRSLTVCTALSFLFMCIHVFRSLDLIDALLYFRRSHPFHREGEIDARPYVVFTVFAGAMVFASMAFGVRLW